MKPISFLLMLFVYPFAACNEDEPTRTPDTTYLPDIRPELFLNSTTITNPYFPAPENKKYTYEGQTEDGMERITEQRLNITRTVQGIECIVVNFKAYLDDVLMEEADDWYAQDNDGTVWYFGEDVNNYNTDGTIRDHAGSWEAGVDGAKAGIIMLANPVLDSTYREEYYFNEAEDEARITGINLDVLIAFGNFNNCIRTENWTDLEPDVLEEKFYAPGIGLVKETNSADGEEIFLISIE